MADMFGPFGGGSSSGGKIDWNRLKQVMHAMHNGTPLSAEPFAQPTPFPLSGGQPRTYTPSPAPNIPFMPPPRMGGPQTFQPNTGVGMPPMAPPVPGGGPTPMPMPMPMPLPGGGPTPMPMPDPMARRPQISQGLPMSAGNFGMGLMRARY